MTDEQSERATALGQSLFGEGLHAALLRELAEADQQFAELFEQFVFAGMYDRSVLDQKTRELCAVAALTIQKAPQQLAAHMQAAKRMGATRAEIQEVVLQMIVYGGGPCTLQALRLFKKMVAEGKL